MGGWAGFSRGSRVRWSRGAVGLPARSSFTFSPARMLRITSSRVGW